MIAICALYSRREPIPAAMRPVPRPDFRVRTAKNGPGRIMNGRSESAVGFIGLGSMGTPMALNLARAGLPFSRMESDFK